MRAISALAVVIGACASAPAKTTPEDKPAAIEPARLPDLPAPALADRIIEAQKVSQSNGRDAFTIVEVNLQSNESDRVRAALAVIAEMAASIERMRAARGPDDDEFFYRAYQFDLLVNDVNAALDQRLQTAPCGLISPVYEVAARFRRLPGFYPPKATFRAPPDDNRMSTRAIVCGMLAIKDQIAACYARYQIPGNVMVNVVIGKEGTVTAATTTGKFAGTPTGDCVAAAAKTATFPRSDGIATPFPFVLK